jgi:lipopolysaccharide/colanic/teichoic acid biosynthesis glycosyltransferase
MTKTPKLQYYILAADLCWTINAMALAFVLRYGMTWQNPTGIPAMRFLRFLIVTLIFWSVLSSLLHLDGFRGGWRLPAMLSQLFPAVFSLMVLLFAGAYLARWYTSRLVLGYFGILLFLGFVAIRLAARAFLASRHRNGAVRKAVIVGSGRIASEIALKIKCHPEMLWEVIGFLCPADNGPNLTLAKSNAKPIAVRSVGVSELLRSRSVNEIILAVSKPDHPEISDLVTRCLNQGIAVSLVPQPYDLYLSRPKLIDLDGLPLLKLEGVPATPLNPIWKPLFDLALTACLLPIAGPVVLAAAVWLKIRKGKGFCSEVRCGQFGEPFLMYRLNSDRHAVNLPLYEALMQQSSFTELPQILNVIRGEMSLVGPRPEPPERVHRYSDWNRQRLSVKPGITGLAQVHGLREQNSSEDKTRYDLEYILHRSWFLDISLLLQTLWTLTVRLLQLKRPELPSPYRSVHVDTSLKEGLSSAHSPQSSTD